MALFEYTPSGLSIKLTKANTVTLYGVDGKLIGLIQASYGFDQTLLHKWNAAQGNGLFRYKFNINNPSRIISEKFQFILQLNPDRAQKRRKPEEISSLNQPFNSAEFNFRKVKTDEVIMSLKPVLLSRDCINGISEDDTHVILINVSPLELGHVLLVPSLIKNQPQQVTLEGLRLATEMLLLSRSPDFRVGFNSLCGYDSVNHHHYHGYYLKHRLFIEYAKLKRLAGAGSCMEFSDYHYPAPGFVFVLADLVNIDAFLSEPFRLVSYFQENELAHNLYITRGSSRNQLGHFDSVRLIIWARTCSYGSKASEGFNPALCELAGHFPIKNNKSYETLTEEIICKEIRSICLEPFTLVRHAVLSLFQSNNAVNE